MDLLDGGINRAFVALQDQQVARRELRQCRFHGILAFAPIDDDLGHAAALLHPLLEQRTRLGLELGRCEGLIALSA